MRKFLWAALALSLLGQNAMAAINLQITEMWPGNEPGSNLTDDWFEVTNFGDMAWTAAGDGDLYYDDDSADATAADLLSGVASIAPGESVIFVDGSATTGAANVAFWHLIWDGDLSSVPQVGTYEGSGMSQGGDGATLFLDADNNGPSGAEIIDLELYPDANAFGGKSYDSGLGQFSSVGNASGAIATTALNDENQPAIGSPGSAAVPEPTSMALAVLGLIGVLYNRRK